jgi:hypothetical protein
MSLQVATKSRGDKVTRPGVRAGFPTSGRLEGLVAAATEPKRTDVEAGD